MNSVSEGMVFVPLEEMIFAMASGLSYRYWRFLA
jgi:hypothetical protein